MCVMYDDRDPQLSKNFINSIRKFHDEKELPIKEVKRTDKQEWVDDPHFYFRAKGLIAKEFINDYELVIVADSDQICLGSLDYVLNSSGWDVGTVLNWNRTDPNIYGLVSVFNIDPRKYFNAGLIAFRNNDVVDHLVHMCNSPYFHSLQYREQDILNIILHFGMYKVNCFDTEDTLSGYNAWHGLIAKGEGLRMKKINNDVVLLPDEGGYPIKPTFIKMFHWAGGSHENKNHRLSFNEEMIEYIDYLISEEKDE